MGNGEVRLELDKVVAGFPRPQTKKDVRVFLGLSGYYRRFIPDYMALQLTDLTKKTTSSSKTINWTSDLQSSVSTAQSATHTWAGSKESRCLPLLYPSNWCFRSRSKSCVKQWSWTPHRILQWKGKATRGTLVNHWKGVFGDKTKDPGIRLLIEIQTDHKSLEWLHRMKGDNARLMRWSLALLCCIVPGERMPMQMACPISATN